MYAFSHATSIHCRCLMTRKHLKDGTVGIGIERGITQLAIRQTRLCPTAAMTDDNCILKFCFKAANANQDRKLEWQRAKITADFSRRIREGILMTLEGIRVTESRNFSQIWF